MKILNFGSMNLDYVYRVEHLVLPGETLSAEDQQISCGGKGLNQSVALAKAGAQVYHAGCVGSGGERLVDLLRRFGVHTEHIRKTEKLQGNALIQVDKNGQNCIILFGGSNQCITKEQVKKTLEDFCDGDYIVLQNEVNELPEIVDQAYEKGMNIVLNPSPCDDKLKAIDFSKLSWLILNEVEAKQLLGSDEPEKVRAILWESYPHLSAVLTLGEDGSVCFSGDGMLRQKAYTVSAVDTTAAGDTFTGYFLTGLTKGLSLAECMKRASAAAALCVTRPGAADAVPTEDEVTAVLEEWE